MKQTGTNTPIDILNQIETIEKEILNLKLSLLRKLAPPHKKTIKLKGILKGIEITDEDILSAQKSHYQR